MGRGRQCEGRATVLPVQLDLNGSGCWRGSVLPDGLATLAEGTVSATPPHVVHFGGAVGLNREYAMGLKKIGACSSTRDD